ncbi:bifunctional folylpolyglutamate synthase/dihydrofolate synthase [Calditrichota bacterium]
MNTREADLERFRDTLSELGNPQDDFKIIHIAGTKGKGSTAAMLASILQECGYRTGLYTSPHLITVRERIVVDGEEVSRVQFAEAMTTIRRATRELLEEQSLAFRTVFEHLTAAAMLVFQDAGVEIAVVETGLGGKLDTTVVFDPILTIMTPIGLDHTLVLGDTIAEIAWDKAHILKRDVPAVTAPQTQEAITELVKRAKSIGTVLHTARGKSEFQVIDRTLFGTKVESDREWLVGQSIQLPLAGSFQLTNLSTVLTAVEQLQKYLDLKNEVVIRGIASAKWEGRLQVVGDSAPIILDGSHNELAMQSLFVALDELSCRGKLHVVFSALKGKPVKEMLQVMDGMTKQVYLTEINFPKVLPLCELEQIADSLQIDYKSERNSAAALDKATAGCEAGDYVLVTGSFYLVGETMRHLRHLPAPPSDGRIDDAI